MDVIELAVNVIKFRFQKVKKQHFMDVIELAVNVIIIQILESEETIFFRQQFLDVIALAVNVM